MPATPPPQIAEILETLGVATPAQVRRAGRYVRRMTRRMPQFQSVWLDALVRYGTLSRWQASEIDAGRGGRLLLGPYALVEPLADCLYAQAYRARHVESGEAVRVVVAERTGRAASETAGRLRELVEIASPMETSHFLPPKATGQAEPRPTAPPPVVGDVAGHAPRHAAGPVRLWVAAPWTAGQSAADWLIGHGRMPSEAVLEMARAMTAGLVALEAVGLCHGDIGASSLWLADDGRVVLPLPGVRGILRPEEGYGRADLLPEAFDYLAPERVARGTAPNIASDLYASGCVWWHLLCGRPPLAGGDSLAKLRAAHEARIADPRELAPDTPPVLAEAVLACTRAEPERRPHSAAELVALLGPPAPARRRRLRRSLHAAEQPQLGWPSMRAPEAVRAGRQFGRAAAASLALAAALLVAAWPVWRAVREKAAETKPSRLASMMHDDTTPPSDSRTTPGDSAAGHAAEVAGHGVVHAAYSAPSDEEGSPADKEAAHGNDPSDAPHRTAGSSNRTTPAREPALDQLRLNPRERLELRPGQRVGGRDGARVRLNVPSGGLHIVVEDTGSEAPVFFEAIDFVWDPAGAAAVTVEAGNVSFQHCTFDGRAAGAVPPAAVRWVHPSASRPDVPSLPSGTIRFSDCLFQDVAAAIDCQAPGAVRIEFQNVLHLGPGPLGLSSQWPRADESINLVLAQVTVRGATALWRFSLADPAPAPGRVLVRADRSVFAPTEGGALLLFRGDGNVASVLEGLSWSGEGALVSPGIQIVARETPGGMPERLDDAGVPIAGLVLSRVEFAGPAGGGAANSALLRWNAPLRTSDPPGCNPARLPAL